MQCSTPIKHQAWFHWFHLVFAFVQERSLSMLALWTPFLSKALTWGILLQSQSHRLPGAILFSSDQWIEHRIIGFCFLVLSMKCDHCHCQMRRNSAGSKALSMIYKQALLIFSWTKASVQDRVQEGFFCEQNRLLVEISFFQFMSLLQSYAGLPLILQPSLQRKQHCWITPAISLRPILYISATIHTSKLQNCV